MNKKLEFLANYLLSLLGAFILGLYALSTKYDIREVEPYRWAVTGFFTLMFIVLTFKSRNER